MARRRNNKKQEETLVDLVEARDNAKSFLDRNQNLIFGGLIALVVLIGGIVAYNQFYKMPKEKEASDQMRQAHFQFARDSFALALTNPGGGNSGFIDIIKNYGSTEAGNLANYYAGACYLNLGKFDVAIDYLKSYGGSGEILPITTYGMIADAQGELGKFDEALSSYKKAISAGENEMLEAYYLKKLGLLQEKQGKHADAKVSFEKISSKYPNSSEANDIQRYITRAAAKI